jgi:twitching motility protein PilT
MDAPTHREPEVNKLFRMTTKLEASGFYLRVGSPPQVRLRGVLRTIDLPPLSGQDLERLVRPLLCPEQAECVERGEDVAFTYACEEGSMYNVSVSRESGDLRFSAHRQGTS